MTVKIENMDSEDVFPLVVRRNIQSVMEPMTRHEGDVLVQLWSSTSVTRVMTRAEVSHKGRVVLRVMTRRNSATAAVRDLVACLQNAMADHEDDTKVMKRP